ncbi:MAG: hypothetical protein AAGG07_08290 [Planctomycetota bacterium]
MTQFLDEQHMAAFSTDARKRVGFATAMGHFLESQRDTEVVHFYGRHITDLEGFCYQLESALPGAPLTRKIDGPSGIVNLLRHRHTFAFRPPARWRYYIWHDADVLLDHDERLFGRLADALMGAAAEAEYVSDEVLQLQRVLFVGGARLESYARDPEGQMRCWHDDGQGEPFWRVVTGIETPSVMRYPIDVIDR